MRHLHGTIQNYAWGSPTAIPRLFDMTATGEPVAEYWLGAHTSSPSTLDDGTGLDAAISREPALLGDSTRQSFGDRLPFLLKVLAAAEPLSLQSHPTRAQAEEGFARENAAGIALDAPTRVYRDDWPKPEMVVALGEYHALCGFRDPAETLRLFDQLGLGSVFSDLLAPLSSRDAEAGLAEVFLRILQLDDRTGPVLELRAAAERHLDAGGDVADFARLALRLAEHHDEDPGVIAGLLMNHVVLQAGQAVHLGAGNLHCYLEGLGIEIMANSDNVVRGGLTGKHVDVDELVRVVSFRPGAPDLIVPTEVSPGLQVYQANEPEFCLWRFHVAPGQSVRVPAEDSARIVLVLDGSVLNGADTLTRSEAGFLSAGEKAILSGTGSGFIAASGLQSR